MLPPMTVIVTRRSDRRSGGRVVGSWLRATRSARIPGAIAPRLFSWQAAYAAAAVCIAMARAALTRSAGSRVSPDAARRVTAAIIAASGSGWVTGASELAARVKPILARDLKG